MTIAAGFVCRDGLVLFADTEEQEGYTKTSVEKIRTTEDDGRSFVIANAGNGYLADSLVDRLFDALASTKKEKDVLPAIRTTLIDFHRNEVALYPCDDSGKRVGLVMGLQLSGDPMLLHSDATALRRVREFAVIGYGAELKYLAQQLYRRNMPLKHGVLIAMHLARMAREYVQGCGGESRVATLSNHKTEILHKFDVWADEQLFSALSDVYRAVLLSIPDCDISEEAFENCVNWFVEKAWKARSDMVQGREFNKEIKEKIAAADVAEKDRFGIERFYESAPKPADWNIMDRRRRLKKTKTLASLASGKSKDQP
jgi:20S proteasome alpha/beta subunit